jgi:energy-coupling factor transport system permease protein
MYSTGSYIARSSPLHHVDPRIKLAGVVGLSFIILLTKPIPSLFIGLVLTSLVFVSRISLRIIWQAFQPLLFFLVLIFLVHALFTEGDTLFRIPFIGLSFSGAGLIEGIFIAWKFLCLILAAVLLTMTTSPSYLIAAVKFYLHPLQLLRLPVDSVAVMITLALRLMPLLLTEKNRIEIARKARGYDISRARLRLHIRAFLSLVHRIFLGVFKKADELAAAMEARNYSLGRRTSIVELRLATLDFISLFFLGIFFIIFIALNYRFS